MKFTKGYWLNLPGVENYDCVQIREVKVSRDQVYLYAVPYAEDERAVGGPALEIFLSSPRRDILRTQAYHFMGSGKKEPQFHLETEDLPLEVSEFEGALPSPAAAPPCGSPPPPPPLPITIRGRS